jgi:hypothetical protein
MVNEAAARNQFLLVVGGAALKAAELTEVFPEPKWLIKRLEDRQVA